MNHTPFYSQIDYGSYRPLTMDDAHTSLWQSMKGAFTSAWNMSPTQSIMDTAEMRGDQFFADAFSSTISDADIVNDIALGNPTAFDPPEPLDMSEQERRIEEAGLTGILAPDPMDNERGLTLKIARKRSERAREALADKAPAWHAPFSLAAGFVGGMIDPVNIASCFIPIIGEERMLSMLGQAASGWGRAAARARAGAISGAAGAALVEPIVYGTQSELSQDYGMAQSLINVGAGAVLGASLGPVAGHVGEWWRDRRGIEQPWMSLPETEESLGLMNAHGQSIENALWHTAMTPEERHASAMDAARAYDVFARRAARNGQSLQDVYNAWTLEYQAGEFHIVDSSLAPGLQGADYQPGDLAQIEFNPAAVNDDVLYAGAELSRAQTLEEFFAEIEHNAASGRTRTINFDFGREVTRADVSEGAHRIVLGQHMLAHIRKDHPDYNRWAEIPDVIEKGEVIQAGRIGTLDAPAFLFYNIEKDKVHAVLAADMSSKGWGTRFMVHTAYEGTLRNFKGYLEGRGMPVPRALLAALQRMPKPHTKGGDVDAAPGTGAKDVALGVDGVNNEMPAPRGSDVNPDTLNQLAPDFTPMAQVQFFEDARAMVTFFRSADATSAPHELYHIIRRRMAEEAKQSGSPLARDYAALEKAFGVKDGQWTRAQEEAFAETMVSLLTRKAAAPPSLAGAIATCRQKLFEAYAEADAAGLPISPGMREQFNGLMTTTPEEGRQQLTMQIADLTTRRWEQMLIDPSLAREPAAIGARANARQAAREPGAPQAAQAAMAPALQDPGALPGDRAYAAGESGQAAQAAMDPTGQAAHEPAAPQAAPARDASPGIIDRHAPDLSPDAFARLEQDTATTRSQTETWLDAAPPELARDVEQIRADRDAALKELARQENALPAREREMAEALACFLGAA